MAITPRSFANGPYFRDLRSELLKRGSFRRIHVFEARDRVFADAYVLQENIIFSMQIGSTPTDITVTTSRDAIDNPSLVTRRPDQIVHPAIPTASYVAARRGRTCRSRSAWLRCRARCQVLDFKVSTGRVVDFRAKEHLRAGPSEYTVPLVYPQNLRAGGVEWPTVTRKPQALVLAADTANLLLPNENYVLVKRFSSKEEPRRVVAAVAKPRAFGGAEAVAYENHLNVFHVANRGLDARAATGLAAYLNSRFVDDFVRQFNGHTQINATDLRELRYPTVPQLRKLGSAASRLRTLSIPTHLTHC